MTAATAATCAFSMVCPAQCRAPGGACDTVCGPGEFAGGACSCDAAAGCGARDCEDCPECASCCCVATCAFSAVCPAHCRAPGGACDTVCGPGEFAGGACSCDAAAGCGARDCEDCPECANCCCAPLGPGPAPAPAGSNVWVSATGADGPNCGAAPASPCATLQAAARPGAIVHVLYSAAPLACPPLGTFIDFALSIIGTPSAITGQVPVIDCGGHGRALNFSVPATASRRPPRWQIESLVIRGGRAPLGGGILVVNSFALNCELALVNVDITDCVATGVNLPPQLGRLKISLAGASVGGGALLAIGAVSLAATGCTFEFNRAEQTDGSGGAIGMANPDPYVGNQLVLTDCSFRNNTSEGAGGAWFIAADGGMLDTAWLFTRVLATGNAAGSQTAQSFAQGGVALFYPGYNVTNFILGFEDCVFSHNIVHFPKGAVKVDKCGGGAFCWDSAKPTVNTTIHVNNSVLVGNSAPECDGGAVLVAFNAPSANTSVLIENTVVENNLSGGDGGGLYLGLFQEPATNLRFVNCSGGSDSALGLTCPQAVPLTSLPGYGYRSWGTPLTRINATLNNVSVTGNRAHKRSAAGGGLRVGRGGTLLMRDCTVESNYCGRFGGGIHVSTGGTALTLDSTVVTQNTASSGIGMQMDHASGGALLLTGSTRLDLDSSVDGDTGLEGDFTGMFRVAKTSSITCPPGCSLKNHSCVPCPSGTYSFAGARTKGFDVLEVDCKPCVYAAMCNGSNLVTIKQDFWPFFTTPFGNARSISLIWVTALRIVFQLVVCLFGASLQVFYRPFKLR
eukprot:g4150.t1